jgi:hypothetical protein
VRGTSSARDTPYGALAHRLPAVAPAEVLATVRTGEPAPDAIRIVAGGRATRLNDRRCPTVTARRENPLDMPSPDCAPRHIDLTNWRCTQAEFSLVLRIEDENHED